ncbi:hypothetical protein CRENBAI_026305 [Crenichthys baileyi]|uniref:Uncharacterized protein n=1 Tax=Crenichthys baileyi TaxID=28760 RepID=A0AAV9RC20_9TELE
MTMMGSNLRDWDLIAKDERSKYEGREPKKVEGFAGHVGYLKERRKELEKRRSGGAAAGAAKKWRFSAVLSFLDPFVAPRPTTSNMGQVEEMAEDLPAPPPEEDTSEGGGGQCDPGRSHLRWNGRF